MMPPLNSKENSWKSQVKLSNVKHEKRVAQENTKVAYDPEC